MVSFEIHDGLVQHLAAAIMQFEMFGRPAECRDKEVWKTFDSGLAMLSESMREARRLVNGLRSPILDELGLVAAIEDLISQNSNQDRPESAFVHHLDRERQAPPLENVIFRIVQESLTNARRCSQSDRLLVMLTQRDDYIRIEVQDWGIGFNPREVGDGHFGLEGIQERARLFGGISDYQECLGQGNPDRGPIAAHERGGHRTFRQRGRRFTPSRDAKLREKAAMTEENTLVAKRTCPVAAASARSVRKATTMLRVVLFSHTDGAKRERGYIEFTDLLVEHVNDWAYRCQPSGLLTLEQVKGIVEILLWSEANSGTVGKYRWEKMARMPIGKQTTSPRYSEHAYERSALQSWCVNEPRATTASR